MCANCSDDLLDAFTEDSPAPLVVVDQAGGIAAQVRCAVDEFGGGVKKPGEPSRPAHVDSHSCRGEVDVVEDVGGSTEEPGDEGAIVDQRSARACSVRAWRCSSTASSRGDVA
jgi:hypothetical protein